MTKRTRRTVFGRVQVERHCGLTITGSQGWLNGTQHDHKAKRRWYDSRRFVSMRNTTIPPQGPTALSLFSGCGGFCEGIRLAGFKVAAAVEADRFAAETYRSNFPEVDLFEGDVRDYTWTKPDRVDLLFGGPPCQGFSQIGTRDPKDGRNQLYMQFIRLIREQRPRFFLMENVPNLLMMQKGYYREVILRAFRAAGYSNATVIKVTASDFGVPQNRHRVVFIGTRDEDRFRFDLSDFFKEQLELLKTQSPPTVWDAIGDLPAAVTDSGETLPYPKKLRPASNYQKLMRVDSSLEPYSREIKQAWFDRRGKDVLLHNHHTKEIQQKRLRLIAHLGPGQKANSLPKRIWNGTRPEKWRRLDPDAPAYTLLANMHRDLSEFVHPKLERWITVREAARLQSFHDGFVFGGSEWQQLKQIGNAVPPLLGFALGKAAHQVLAALQGKEARRTRGTQFVLPLPAAKERIAASF